jgi:hypothetical protein
MLLSPFFVVVWILMFDYRFQATSLAVVTLLMLAKAMPTFLESVFLFSKPQGDCQPIRIIEAKLTEKGFMFPAAIPLSQT